MAAEVPPGEFVMHTFLQDLRFGARMLWKTPGFTVVAVLALALGIGANTAIFSVVNAVMLRPLPFPEPDRLMMIFHSYPKMNLPRASVSPRGYSYYAENARSFQSVAAFTGWRAPQNLTGSGEPERVRSILATASFFPTVGVPPMLGRTFSPDEDEPGRDRVAVLSYGLWQQRFGGDRGVLGSTMTLDGNNYTVIGVMPPEFRFPSLADLWVPLALAPKQRQGSLGMEFLNVIGRLKASVAPSQGQAEMQRITADLLKQFPDRTESSWRVLALPLKEVLQGEMRPALLVLLGAVGFVLLIACANVANLLLARSTARIKEIAIRTALGASRLRLVRQLLTESVLLAVIGGLLGLALAYWGLAALLALIPIQLPSFIKINIDTPVMLFTLILAVATGLVFGLAPAFQISSGGVAETLKEGGRTSQAAGRHRLRGALVVSEIAFALVLLIGAGLMIRSFIRIQQANFGFDATRVLTFEISLPQARYSDDARVRGFFQQVLQRISTLPGVVGVGASSGLPLSLTWTQSYDIEGKQYRPEPHSHFAIASPGYFSALRIPLLRGRSFAESDSADAPPVVVIDERTARMYWPGEDPVGKRVSFDNLPNTDKPRWREVIGVVGGVKHASAVEEETKGTVYLPMQQEPARSMAFTVRTQGDPLPLARAVREQVLAVDSLQAVYNFRSMEQLLDEFVAQPRFNMVLLGIFAGLALVLAAVGIYGVISYSVTQRTHEIGVRMALGAQRADVVRLILSHGLRLALVGLAIGIAGALASTRALSRMLFGVSTTDPVTFAGLSLLLIAVAAVASYVPARRAMRVDPMVALRYE